MLLFLPRWLFAFALAITMALTGRALAHEGHAPLPTRGVTVDAAKGLVTVSPEARNVLGVKTATVVQRPVERRILAYVRVVAPWTHHAFVTPKMPGRIMALTVLPGQTVKQGDVVGQIQPSELETFQLELANARNDAALSGKLLKLTEDLAGQGTGAAKDVDEARAKHQQNLGLLQLAKSKLLGLGVPQADVDRLSREPDAELLRTIPLAAPISGTIIHVEAAVGRIVDAAEHLMEVIDYSKAWAKIDVLERDIGQIAVGMPVDLSFTSYPREALRSVISVKDVRLDPQTHLGTVWAELGNEVQSTRFLPGMSGKAEIIAGSSKKSLAVSNDALFMDGAEHFVLVENASTAAGSEFQKRTVMIGTRAGGWAEVLRGEIFAGDRTVTTGGHQLAGLFASTTLRPSPEATAAMRLEVKPVVPQVIEPVLETDGAIDLPPAHRAVVATQLPGVLETIKVERAAYVRKGDALAEIWTPELRSAQSDFLRNAVQIAYMESSVRRLQAMAESIEKRTLWEAESQLTDARNKQRTFARRLETMGLSQEQIAEIAKSGRIRATVPVRAPIDGFIVSLTKVLGQAIKAEDSIFEIQNITGAQVQAYLSEREIGRVHVGQKARVRLSVDPAAVLSAKVVRNSRSIGEDNRTVSVWLQLEQPTSNAYQNMLARISFLEPGSAPTLAVPSAAVAKDGTRTFVFVRKPDGAFERRSVTLGRSNDRWIEVLAGISAGEDVAFSGAAELQSAFVALR
jgi:cobalt-zinc-cadmium efflux system membrane fusion protein